MRRLALPTILGFVALAYVPGCTNNKGDSGGGANCTPIAKAPDDQAGTLGSTITLDDTKDGKSLSTTCNQAALAYTWSFLQVPTDSAINDSSLGTTNGTSSAQSVTFVPDAVGSYVLSLTVSDGTSSSAADVTVVTITSDNLPPIADAGPDATGTVNQRVLLDGSGSSDPEGAALTYVWTFASLPTGSARGSADLYDSTTDHASFIPDVSGTYVLGLTVSDGISWSDVDYVNVVVDSENHRPIADAGTGETLSPCNGSTVRLDGWGSYDPDGDPLTYKWSVSSVPSGSTATDANFDDATKPDAKFTWDVVGDYTFSLQVSDGKLTSAEDVVTMTVTDPGTNHAPVANAGSDQSISASADCTSSDYVWSCQPCDAQKVTLDGSSSTDADGDNLSYHWYDDTDSAASAPTIDSPYTAYTVVHTPQVDATYGTAKSTTMTVTLQVADCSSTDSDDVTITVACTGAKASK